MVFFSLAFASESRVQVPSEEEKEKTTENLSLPHVSPVIPCSSWLWEHLSSSGDEGSRRRSESKEYREEIVYFICFLMSLPGEERALKLQLKWSQSMATTADARGKKSTWSSREERVLCVCVLCSLVSLVLLLRSLLFFYCEKRLNSRSSCLFFSSFFLTKRKRIVVFSLSLQVRRLSSYFPCFKLVIFQQEQQVVLFIEFFLWKLRIQQKPIQRKPLFMTEQESDQWGLRLSLSSIL